MSMEKYISAELSEQSEEDEHAGVGALQEEESSSGEDTSSGEEDSSSGEEESDTSSEEQFLMTEASPPRTPEETASFKAGLRASNIWYGHAATVCWLQTQMPVGFDGAPYERSGWCFVEASISAVIKDGRRRCVRPPAAPCRALRALRSLTLTAVRLRVSE